MSALLGLHTILAGAWTILLVLMLLCEPQDFYEFLRDLVWTRDQFDQLNPLSSITSLVITITIITYPFHLLAP